MKNRDSVGIAFILATQYDNMGDLLINKCLIDEVSKYGNIYLDTKGAPEEFKALLLRNPSVSELSSHQRLSFKGIGALFIPFFTKVDIRYLFKSPGPFGGANSIGEKAKYLAFAYIFKLLNVLHSTKTFLVGNDVVIVSEFDRRIFSYYSKVTEGIFVRSKSNINFLNSKNISNVHYIPDMCFLMKDKVNVNNDRIRIGISFRDLGNETLNQEIFSSVSNYLEHFEGKGYEIVIFTQVARDLAFNRRIYDMFKGKFEITLLENVFGWDDISFYANIFSVLSNRLHVLLLAQIHEAIPFGLLDNNAKTSKIRALYETTEADFLIFTSINTEQVAKIIDDHNKTLFRIRDINEKQFVLAKNTIRDLFQITP